MIVLLILVINAINVAISFIARHIDNALVNHQSEVFWRIVAIYGLALMMALPIRANQFYLIPRAGVLSMINSRLALLLIVYAVFGTALVLLASGRLVELNGEQLRLEADFRYGLVRLRDNAESIAFYWGEAREGEQAQLRQGRAISNAQRLITWEALIGVIQSSHNYSSDFLPWLVIAPLYFARQGRAASAGAICLSHVQLIPPGSDRPLIGDLSFCLEQGERLLVMGPSGFGMALPRFGHSPGLAPLVVPARAATFGVCPIAALFAPFRGA